MISGAFCDYKSEKPADCNQISADCRRSVNLTFLPNAANIPELAPANRPLMTGRTARREFRWPTNR